MTAIELDDDSADFEDLDAVSKDLAVQRSEDVAALCRVCGRVVGHSTTCKDPA